MGILLFYEEQVRVDTKADSCAKLVQPNSDSSIRKEKYPLMPLFQYLRKVPLTILYRFLLRA